MDGKVALVTGSTAGIGNAIALDLLKNGCSVIITGSRSEEDAGPVLKAAKKNGGVEFLLCNFIPVFCYFDSGPSVNYIQCDLSKDPESLCSKIDELYPSGVNILVNNAGKSLIKPIEETSKEEWNDVFSINVTAPFILSKHLIPKMKQKGWGRVINISSTAGSVCEAFTAAYSSSKHGLNGLTKSTAIEFATSGVTVNAISPTAVATNMMEEAFKKFAIAHNMDCEEMRAKTIDTYCPTKRMVEPKEVAAMVVCLCSDVSKSITGAIIPMDAGHTAR